MKLLRPALIALQFLSQIPVNFGQAPTEKEVGQSLCFYPLVGLALGGLLMGLALLLPAQLPMISAALILICWVLFSGALHLDGLADSADAWLGGRGDPERTLAIMKDPTAGPVAVVVLLLVLLLKFALIHSLIQLQLFWPLLIAPMLGRMALPALLLSTAYVRRQGLGRWLVDYAPAQTVWGVLAAMLLLLLLLAPLTVVYALLSCAGLLLLLRRLMIRRIGGVTGDTLGAALELVEVSALLSLVLLH